MVSIHVIRKGAVCFSNHIHCIGAGREVYRLAVCVSGYGVSEISTRAGVRVDGRMIRASLISGSIAGSGASGGGQIMGWS